MISAAMIEHATIYVFTGAFTGLIAGVIGIGGGVIVVPALLYIYHQIHLVPPSIEMHVAAASSLAIMIFTAQASVRAHIKEHAIRWPIFRLIWPGIIIGVISGAFLAHHLPSHWLKIILGVVLLLIAIKMMLPEPKFKRTELPPPWVSRSFSVFVGIKSGLLGIGGGTILIPYLTYGGIPRRDTASLSALCTLVISTVGTIAFILLGQTVHGLPSYSTGYVYWPAVFWVAVPSMVFAPIGARLTYVLPVEKLKYGLMVVLFVAALELLI